MPSCAAWKPHPDRAFVLTLAAKRRLFIADRHHPRFERWSRKRGEVRRAGDVGPPLSDSQVAELKRILKAKLGRDARLDAKVDPSLLGGLIVKVGSRMIDSSLRTKLEGLRAAMRGQ
jgi:F-type H+-transporting ATPase subunit delta